MFKKIFIDLCNKKGESPSAVCRQVGITPATYSGWNDNTIPRQATLHRIADFFGVTPEYLLGETNTQTELTFPGNETLSKDESKLLLTYKILTEEGKKKAADYLDDLAGNPNYVSDDEIIYLPTAAFDGRFAAGEKVPYTAKELRMLLNAEGIEGEDF